MWFFVISSVANFVTLWSKFEKQFQFAKSKPSKKLVSRCWKGGGGVENWKGFLNTSQPEEKQFWERSEIGQNGKLGALGQHKYQMDCHCSDKNWKYLKVIAFLSFRKPPAFIELVQTQIPFGVKDNFSTWIIQTRQI